MSYFTQSKWWSSILIVLLIINIGTISFFWWDKKHQTPPNAHPNGPAHFLIHELKLNNQQQAAFDSLKYLHQTKMEALKPALRDAKDAFYALLKQPTTNDSLFTQSLQRIGELQQSLDKNTYEHFKQVRKLCTPEQQEIFDSIIMQAIKMMAPPPHKAMHHPKLSDNEKIPESHEPLPPNQ